MLSSQKLCAEGVNLALPPKETAPPSSEFMQQAQFTLFQQARSLGRRSVSSSDSKKRVIEKKASSWRDIVPALLTATSLQYISRSTAGIEPAALRERQEQWKTSMELQLKTPNAAPIGVAAPKTPIKNRTAAASSTSATRTTPSRRSKRSLEAAVGTDKVTVQAQRSLKLPRGPTDIDSSSATATIEQSNDADEDNASATTTEVDMTEPQAATSAPASSRKRKQTAQSKSSNKKALTDADTVTDSIPKIAARSQTPQPPPQQEPSTKVESTTKADRHIGTTTKLEKSREVARLALLAKELEEKKNQGETERRKKKGFTIFNKQARDYLKSTGSYSPVDIESRITSVYDSTSEAWKLTVSEVPISNDVLTLMFGTVQMKSSASEPPQMVPKASIPPQKIPDVQMASPQSSPPSQLAIPVRSPSVHHQASIPSPAAAVSTSSTASLPIPRQTTATISPNFIDESASETISNSINTLHQLLESVIDMQVSITLVDCCMLTDTLEDRLQAESNDHIRDVEKRVNHHLAQFKLILPHCGWMKKQQDDIYRKQDAKLTSLFNAFKEAQNKAYTREMTRLAELRRERNASKSRLSSAPKPESSLSMLNPLPTQPPPTNNLPSRSPHETPSFSNMQLQFPSQPAQSSQSMQLSAQQQYQQPHLLSPVQNWQHVQAAASYHQQLQLMQQHIQNMLSPPQMQLPSVANTQATSSSSRDPCTPTVQILFRTLNLSNLTPTILSIADHVIGNEPYRDTVSQNNWIHEQVKKANAQHEERTAKREREIMSQLSSSNQQPLNPPLSFLFNWPTQHS